MTKKDTQTENEATLANKRIVLLGGSSGIGLAVAQQVVEQGAHPVIVSSNAERVQKAVASVGGKAEGHTLDLSDETSIERFFPKLGPFDHLVYTAGDTLQLKELGTMDLKKARKHSSFVFGQPWLPSNMQVRISGKEDQSY
jgi:NAD(P)-dependent dehydrogenase (short-subunit alcohol dehydrogenase family)